MQSPSKRLRCTAQLLSKRLRCATQPPSKRLRCATQLPTKRLRFTAQTLPVFYNKCTRRVCWCWSGRWRLKRERIAKPSWSPFGWSYRPVCLKPMGHGVPLQLLTSKVLLADILGMSATTQLPAVVGRKLMPAASSPSASQMPAPQEGAKCWHHSSDLGQEEEKAVDLDDTPEDCPHWKDRNRWGWQWRH